MKKHLIYSYHILLLLNLIFMAGCEKEVVETNVSKEVIVESYIQPGDSIGLSVKKLLHYYGTDTVVSPLDNYKISVFVNSVKYELNFFDSGQYYIKCGNLNLKENDSISMDFEFQELKIHAQTIMPSKPTNFKTSATSITVPAGGPGGGRGGGGGFPSFEALTLSWDNPDNSFYMVAVQPDEASPVAINANDTIFGNLRRMFRNEPSETNNYKLNPMSFRYKGRHRIVLYHLNPEYATLYKFSGNTSLNISEPPTNIKNGFGIFTGINSDTLYVNVDVSK